MNWHNVKLVFHRELRDQLRDRRTLFMIMVLPLLLYPGIGIGMVQFTVLFVEQPRQVIVVGREHLPDFPPLIAVDRFVAELFEVPEEAEQLQIVSDEGAAQRLQDGEVQVVLFVPPDTREKIARGEAVKLETHYNYADEKSRIAYLRLKEALSNWSDLIVRDRVESKSLPPDFIRPVEFKEQNIATAQEVSGGLVWAKLFPFLLVIMSLTGAFYPAVDLCAGEKERGTIETLLISPAARAEIVLGKYLTIFLFSVATAVLNLASMATTGWVVAEQMQRAVPNNERLADFQPPGLDCAGWVLLLLLPLAAFFSAMGLALAAFARSTKEGQYYLTPLFLVTMPLVLVTLAPGVELNAFYSVVPITGVALLLKSLIQGHYDVALHFMTLVLLPTALYAALAIRWAIDQFTREEVLFREAERFEPWLWARHLFRDRGAFPSAAEAIFCYAIMLLLVWFLGGFLGPTGAADATARQAALQRSLVVMQIAFVATPAIIMGVMLTNRPRLTLLGRWPSWGYMALAAALAVALHPIAVEASEHIQRGLPSQPKWVAEQLEQLLGGGQPLWWQLILIAALPAVCEELAFRGFILSGLLRRMSVFTAIIVSGFLFGFFHMNPQQLLTTTFLGWILGVVATRSGSLLPGIVFHFTNNALALLMANFQSHMEQAVRAGAAGEPLVRLFDALFRQPTTGEFAHHVPYRVHVLLLCAGLATLVLTWLLKQPARSPAVTLSDNSGDDARALDPDAAVSRSSTLRSAPVAPSTGLARGSPHANV